MPVKGKANRDKHHGPCTTMLHSYDIYTRPAVTGMFAIYEPASADIYCLRYGGFVVEVKTAHNGTFQMGTEPKTGAGWRQDQIEWGQKFVEQSGCEYWLFVVFETTESPHRVPRDAFLVPFHVAYGTMMQIPQKSLPYKVRKHMNTEMQENNWDALNLWKEYRLDWKSGWKVPVTHTFHQLYISPTPRAITTTIESIDLGELQHEYSNV